MREREREKCIEEEDKKMKDDYCSKLERKKL